MAKIVTMPTTPNFIRSNFTLRRAVGSVASPYTGKVRTQEYDGVFLKPKYGDASGVRGAAILSRQNSI